MELPADKTPGYYAQIVKGIAEKVNLLDRDKELLILERDEDKEAVLEVLNRYRVPAEELELLLLPAEAKLYGGFGDYGFTTRMERSFLYGSQTALFVLKNSSAASEPEQAYAQLLEHLLAEFRREHGERVMAADSQQDDLMEGIARAYGCKIEWVWRRL